MNKVKSVKHLKSNLSWKCQDSDSSIYYSEEEDDLVMSNSERADPMEDQPNEDIKIAGPIHLFIF